MSSGALTPRMWCVTGLETACGADHHDVFACAHCSGVHQRRSSRAKTEKILSYLARAARVQNNTTCQHIRLLLFNRVILIRRGGESATVEAALHVRDGTGDGYISRNTAKCEGEGERKTHHGRV